MGEIQAKCIVHQKKKLLISQNYQNIWENIIWIAEGKKVEHSSRSISSYKAIKPTKHFRKGKPN